MSETCFRSSPARASSFFQRTATNIALISQGRLVTQSAPEVLLQSVEGRVWESVVSSAELPVIRERFLTSSAIHRSDGVHVRLLADAPPDVGAVAVAPTLEDAYLHWISTGKRAAA